MSSSPAICASPGYQFPTGGDYFTSKNSPARFKSDLIPKDLPQDFKVATQADYFAESTAPQDDYFVNFSTEGPRPPPIAVKPHRQYESFGSTVSNESGGHSATSSMTFADNSDAGSVGKPRSTTDCHFSFHRSKPLNTSHKLSSPPPLVTLSSLPDQLNSAISPPGISKNNSSPMSLSFGSTKHPHHAIPVPNDSRPLIELLEHVSFLPSTQFSELVDNHKTLVVDVRPFADYLKSHIDGAINICLPLTLLKRQSYTISRCISAMPAYEKSIVTGFVDAHDSTDAVILYDTTSSSSNLYHLACKFAIKTMFKARVYILDEAYAVFKEVRPTNISSGTASVSPSRDSKSDPLSKTLSSCSLAEESKSSTLHFTPILSNFKLPDTPKNIFKIRHNEELLTPQFGTTQTIALRHANMTQSEKQSLPKWLLQSVENPQAIERDFQALEKYEKKRLLHALSGQSAKRQDNLDLSSIFVPAITSGIELGHKNRYKDIFVYEHSRVRLQEPQVHACDYINASYIDPSGLQEFTTDPQSLKCNYIATQGPLCNTIGDFWKCTLDNHCSLIVSLTGETENGVDKCSPFWKAGTYVSNSTTVKVTLKDEDQLEDSLILRRFTVQMNDEEPIPVMQIHLLSWPDMGSSTKSDDILTIVFLKQLVMSKMKCSNDRVLIHCSAGCGRTGTFCAIDTVVNMMEKNGTTQFARDPVYSIVDSFRNQRISMVQNLRQYYSIYDTILLYLKARVNGTSYWRMLEQNELVQAFLNI